MTLSDFSTWIDVEIVLREEQQCAVTRGDSLGEQRRSTLITELRMLKTAQERLALVKGKP